MKINQNIPALQTLTTLNKTNRAQTDSMQRLSSGLRINGSKDDPAGMAIAKKMSAQVDSLQQANRNSLDGISLIQTAEGALNEVHDIARRMRELAIMSATDTYVDEDRKKIQLEIDELVKEIDRIGAETEFNGINVLDGQYEILESAGFEFAQTVTDGGVATTYALTISAPSPGDSIVIDGVTISFYDSTLGVPASADDIDISGDWQTAIAYQSYPNYTGRVVDGEIVLTAIDLGTDLNDTDPVGDATGAITATSRMTAYGINDGAISQYEVKLGDDDPIVGQGFTIDGIAFEYYDSSDGEYMGTAQPLDINGDILEQLQQYNFDNITVSASATDGYDITITAKASGADGDYIIMHNGGSSPREVFIQSGASANQLTLINLASANSEALGLTSRTWQNGYTDYLLIEDTVEDDINTNRYGVSLLNIDDANNAIGIIDNAIAEVSAQRAYMGAMQNRLEYTVKNLGVTVENATSSLSRIQDTDMAEEMAEFTKNNILTQAATSMMAQANQLPQQVFQLLQG
ncbi:MAG: hypothetical protein BEN19_06970 [Epulopiscium sp. Nuni2H_MBin003]|nr:MAG: hypothetical protein BEN19_06970 [Epulopiscium sp. Nuni2H_MBin003]